MDVCQFPRSVSILCKSVFHPRSKSSSARWSLQRWWLSEKRPSVFRLQREKKESGREGEKNWEETSKLIKRGRQDWTCSCDVFASLSVCVCLSAAEVCACSKCILFMFAEVTANFHDNGTLCFVLSCKCAKSVVSLCLFLRDSTVFFLSPLWQMSTLLCRGTFGDARDVLFFFFF